MKIFKKLSSLCLVMLAVFTLSIATPAVSFAKASPKAHTTVRTSAKKTAAKARLTAAKRTAAKARLTAAKRTAKARPMAAKRTTAKARLTAAKAPALKAGARAKVTAKALNVRTGPAKTYKKVGTLRKGAVVKIVSTKAGWKKVQYGTRTGYVSSKYLK